MSGNLKMTVNKKWPLHCEWPKTKTVLLYRTPMYTTFYKKETTQSLCHTFRNNCTLWGHFDSLHTSLNYLGVHGLMKQRFEKLVLFLVHIRIGLQFSITVLSGMKSNIFLWNLLLVIIQFHVQVLEKSSDQSQPFHSWEDKEILKQTKLNMKSIITRFKGMKYIFKNWISKLRKLTLSKSNNWCKALLLKITVTSRLLCKSF